MGIVKYFSDIGHHVTNRLAKFELVKRIKWIDGDSEIASNTFLLTGSGIPLQRPRVYTRIDTKSFMFFLMKWR